MADPGKENIQAAATTWEDLPESVIEHIQSFLPVKEAIRSCLISKSSLHVIPTSPDLIFGLHLDPDQVYSVDQITKLSSDIIEFIGKTMARYRKQNLPIHRFDLNLFLDCEQSASVAPLLHDWLRIVTTSSSRAGGLKHLALQADFLDVVEEQVPSVRGCDMVNLSSLVTLFLRDIHFDDDDAVAKIFSNCPLLEKIRVVRCTGDASRRVRVTNVPRLRELDFSSVCNKALIVDKAPALVSLTYEATLKHPSVLYLKAARYSLKSLTLERLDISRILVAKVISKLPVLEDLSICFCRPLSIELASDSLKRLTIKHYCDYLFIKLDAPKLVLLSYDGSVVPTLNSPSNTWMQLKFSFSIDHLDSFYHFRWSQLGELLLKTGQSDISIGMSELVRMHALLKARLENSFLKRPSAASPAKNVKNVWFTDINSVKWTFPLILDSLFSVCHPEFACMTCLDDNVPFMKFLLTKLMGRRHKRCCASEDQTKCWRHYLKKGLAMEIRSEACADDEEGWKPLPFHWRDLVKGPADKREGYDIRIRLSWSDHPF